MNKKPLLPSDTLSNAVHAVKEKRMSLRESCAAFGVSKSRLQRLVTGDVSIDSRNDSAPILYEDEVLGILEAVDDRTNHGYCFTTT